MIMRILLDCWWILHFEYFTSIDYFNEYLHLENATVSHDVNNEVVDRSARVSMAALEQLRMQLEKEKDDEIA